jgi:hypothetical protein
MAGTICKFSAASGLEQLHRHAGGQGMGSTACLCGFLPGQSYLKIRVPCGVDAQRHRTTAPPNTYDDQAILQATHPYHGFGRDRLRAMGRRQQHSVCGCCRVSPTGLDSQCRRRRSPCRGHCSPKTGRIRNKDIIAQPACAVAFVAFAAVAVTCRMRPSRCCSNSTKGSLT